MTKEDLIGKVVESAKESVNTEPILNKDDINAILLLLSRVNLRGAEALDFVTLVNKLNKASKS